MTLHRNAPPAAILAGITAAHLALIVSAAGAWRTELWGVHGSLPPGAGTWSADGTIRLEIDPALVGSPEPGYVLSAVVGEVRLLVGAACSGLLQTLDSGAGLPYTFEGNDYCVPHTVTCATGDIHQPGDHLLSFTVENPSTAPRPFNVTLSDPNGWLVGGPFNVVVGPVNGNSSATISAVLRLPNDCAPANTDLVLFEAEALDLPPSSSYASCTSDQMCSAAAGVPDGSIDGRLNFAVAGRNPFQGATRLRFDLPAKSPVTVTVFTVSGQRVRTLVSETLDAGTHFVDFNMSDRQNQELASGIYLVGIEANGERKSLKLVATR